MCNYQHLHINKGEKYMANYNDIPNILYYYCNINEFIDMITNKRLMLKDLQKCDEFANLNKVIDALANRIQKKVSSAIKGEDKDIFMTIPLFTLKREIEKYKYNMLPFVYAFILTSNCNKWYMYQKNSTDLCVGIRTDLFKNFKSTDIINLIKVNYDINDLENKIDAAIDNYLQEYKQNNDRSEKNLGDVFMNIWKYLNNDLIKESLAYKSAYFAEENEYRLILDSGVRKLFLEQSNCIDKLQGVVNLSFDNNKGSLSKTDFMTENNQLISFRYFGYNNLLSLIESVYINPVGDVTESDIKLLLSAKKIEFDNIAIIKTSIK